MPYQNNETFTEFRTQPRLVAPVFALAVTVLKWGQRQKTRRTLQRLDAHLLKDIGLSARDAHVESKKVFWQD